MILVFRTLLITFLFFCTLTQNFRELYTFGSVSLVGSGLDPSIPKAIPQMNNVKDIFQCKERISFLLKQDGTLYGFGDNNVCLFY